jgi:hypothetical protein
MIRDWSKSFDVQKKKIMKIFIHRRLGRELANTWGHTIRQNIVNPSLQKVKEEWVTNKVTWACSLMKIFFSCLVKSLTSNIWKRFSHVGKIEAMYMRWKPCKVHEVQIYNDNVSSCNDNALFITKQMQNEYITDWCVSPGYISLLENF